MSENEEIPETSETQLLTAEYKDGQLQIVEMNPFDKVEGVNDMPSLEGDNVPKYVQVINPDKSVMQLDLLNLTLVRCEDGSESYRLVSASEIGDSSSEATVTCVLHSSDNEAEVMLADAEAEADAGAYVVMDGRPLVLYEQEPPEPEPAPEPAPQPVQAPVPPRKLTPNEILERAKALQKAKAQLASLTPKRRGRGRRSELPPPHELLASPGFKLFLYSCRMCSFKCNAVKEMTKHKAEHNCWRRSSAGTLQCALCPYRVNTHSQIMKHVQDVHAENKPQKGNKVHLDTAEVAAADVLVCGACGYESSSRPLFRAHIEAVHGATAC